MHVTCMVMDEDEGTSTSAANYKQLLRRPHQCISLRITIESTATILVDIHTNPSSNVPAWIHTCPTAYDLMQVVDSPSSCLSQALRL